MWPPNSPTLSDIALCCCLTPETSSRWQQHRAELWSVLQSSLLITPCEVSDNGLKKLTGMGTASLLIVASRAAVYASTAKTPLKLKVFITLASTAMDLARSRITPTRI